MSHDPIKDQEHAERIEAFKLAAFNLRLARDNVRSSEQRLQEAQEQLKTDKTALDGAHVVFTRQAEGLGFKAPSGSGSLTFKENLLSITGHPTTPAPYGYAPQAPAHALYAMIGAALDQYGKNIGAAPRYPGQSDDNYRAALLNRN
jgi:hypothetical protein